MKYFLLILYFFTIGCNPARQLRREALAVKPMVTAASLNIDSLVKILNPLSAREREKITVPLMMAGCIPPFIFEFKKVRLEFKDSNDTKHKAVIFVSPDYLCIGNKEHFMRMPLTPQAGQQLADSFHCVLPTRKMVDKIYAQAGIKLEPQPLITNRDSLFVFLQHNSIIQQQLNGHHPHKLIAGIKKDIVQSTTVYTAAKASRVAIYGWHLPGGKPIQPLYTGHADWYVDYSHGIRLIYEKMIVDGKRMLVKDVLNNPLLQKIICDETVCGYMRY